MAYSASVFLPLWSLVAEPYAAAAAVVVAVAGLVLAAAAP